jgi:poly(3-hydroxybutyrate) depolymerase
MDRLSYQLYEMTRLAMVPARAMVEASRLVFANPFNPLTQTPFMRSMAAGAELFERVTRHYGKPVFGLEKTSIDGADVSVVEEVVWERPFCRLLRFRRESSRADGQSKLLIVAPMSGHYATLLRGTVAAFLPFRDVYITDWSDASMVPASAGSFDLDEYISYLLAILGHVSARNDGVPVHTLGVCQPSVPLICAVALLEARLSPDRPASMALMGGPIDTRRSPTLVNRLAEERGADWFRRNCIHTIPLGYPGFGRAVYPGFLQLTGFMSMNLDRHFTAHVEMFDHLVKGDGDSAEKHREFYDEYMAVMDLTAEFYLQTVEKVFVNHDLPRGRFFHGSERIDLGLIQHTGLMTIEGENDDISGVGQTFAAQELCTGLPAERKLHHLQVGVGHYGVFNGSRFQAEIMPRVCAFQDAIEQLRPA